MHLKIISFIIFGCFFRIQRRGIKRKITVSSIFSSHHMEIAVMFLDTNSFHFEILFVFHSFYNINTLMVIYMGK